MNDPGIPKRLTPRAVRPHELQDDEIDLRELFGIIWQGKWIVLTTMLVCALMAGAYALSRPDIYRAEALLAPNIGDQDSRLSRLAGQFGGLASLAGVELGGHAADKTTIALEVLESRAFLTNVIRRHKLEVPLMASQGWDKEKEEWRIDPSLYDRAGESWLPQDGEPSSPTDWDLYEVFTKEVLTVNEEPTSGMVRVGVETTSPLASRKWVDWLVSDLNEHMRQLDIAEAQRSISYLEEQLEKTRVTEMQQIFFQLIEQQTRTMMLARVREEYVFKTIDPAVVPQEKAEPRRVLMVALGVILGAMLGLFVVAVRQFLKSGTASVT